MDVRKSAVDPEAAALSGGNLQKFIIGRELDRQPSVMVVNQPTWGVDAGAAARIRQALIELARSGSAVLVISQDLDELFEISDSIAVMHNGELSKPLPIARGDFREDRPADGRRRARPCRAREGGRVMRIELVKRPQRSSLLCHPLAIHRARPDADRRRPCIFAFLGLNPFDALYEYFVDAAQRPVGQERGLAVAQAGDQGRAVDHHRRRACRSAYRSNNWNIGAEGQLIMGAIAGSLVPILLPDFQNALMLPLMLIFGMLGGALYAGIPALLKARFNTNEILTSLMLVYIAKLFVDWLVRGPFRDPKGNNFPRLDPVHPAAARVPEIMPSPATPIGVVVGAVASPSSCGSCCPRR